jgi:2'-5' RNA ligase
VRVFLGVAASAPIAAAAARLSRDLQARTASLAPGARVSWVPADRFHFTILFIGPVDEPRLAALRDALRRPFAEPPFDLAVAGTGTFPGGGQPRVVWAGVTDGSKAFARLQRAAYARVAAVLPLEPEREAQPHLTLARVKAAGGLRGRTLLDGVTDVALGTQHVDAVTLFESRAVRNGVEYRPLVTTSLEAGKAG